MIEHSIKPTKAVVVSLRLFPTKLNTQRDEIVDLVKGAGIVPVAIVRGSLRAINSSTYVGKGKVLEIGDLITKYCAEIVVFDHDLSPIQQRNLNRQLNCRIVDRTTVILDIFSQRAKTHEGKLQVELAQLRYLATRLVKGWTHLERQRGGIGLRGPGETQLETDRRLISKRVKVLEGKLGKVVSRRYNQRRARTKGNVKAVSLVGYTNSGKSSLFNRLTKSSVMEANQLFATLDTTTRRMIGGGEKSILLADTVGFIRGLPHGLVAAFRATLEEAVNSDLLIHVVNCSSPAMDEEIMAVNDVLKEIGAAQIPQIIVKNKIDLVGIEPRIILDPCDKIVEARVSAKDGLGIDTLIRFLSRPERVLSGNEEYFETHSNYYEIG